MIEKCFSFFDFDNTLYRGNSRYLILDFSEFLCAKHVISTSGLEQLKIVMNLFDNGQLDRYEFAVRMVRSYYQNLVGHPESEISGLVGSFWENLPPGSWFPYTKTLLDYTNSCTTTILISGSPYEVLKEITRQLDIKQLHASKGSVLAGKYTGEVEKEMATSQAKAQWMQAFALEVNFDPGTSFAFGDSESDFPLLQAVDPRNAFLVNLDDGSLERSKQKGWNLYRYNEDLLDDVRNRLASTHNHR